jgi:hypothetical protein
VKVLLAIAHYTEEPANADALIRCLVGWRGLATHGEQDFGGPCKATQVHDLDIMVIDDGRHSAMEYVPAHLAERVILIDDPLRLPLACRVALDKRSQGYDLIGYSEHDNWPITPDTVLIPHRFERIAEPPYKVYVDGPNGHSAYGAMWLVTAQQWAHWRKQPHFLAYTEEFAGPLESGCAWSLTKTFHCVKPATFGALESEHIGNRYARRSVNRGVVWTW